MEVTHRSSPSWDETSYDSYSGSSMHTEEIREGPKFYLYPGAIFGPNVQPLWRHFPELQPQLSCFVDSLEAHSNRTRRPEEATVFVVPLYELSHILYGRNRNMSEIEGALNDLRRNLNATTWYIKYGGSNHVFAFPVHLPQHIMTVVIDVLDVDLYSFWLGGGEMEPFLHWRCTHRHIRLYLPSKPKSCNVDKASAKRLPGAEAHRSLSQITANVNECSDDPLWCKDSVGSTLNEIWARTEGRHIWDCGGATGTPTNIVGEYYGAGYDLKDLVRGTLLDVGHRMTMCTIPKCASTVLKMMQKRQTGIDTWKARDPETRWQGLIEAKENLSFYHIRSIIDNTQWVNVATVRDPVVRCLSGYLQKIVQLKQYRYIAWRSSKEPAFEDFVQILYSFPEIRKGDIHFMEQSSFCGFRVAHVDYVARVETLPQDFRELYERLGLWEEFGASGWGEDGDQSFLEAFETSFNHPQRLESSTGDAAVASYYTRDTLEMVYKMYREDFDRLGYSIEKWRRLVDQNGS
eukprot:evm.model.scf_1490.2 EVM.evm.TU.scf_1490.2   scf_1490:31620-33878(+)